ncbi:lactadherin isoform X2 [Nematostella vectensis]|uniref:lactadherin isoform X2 n=1 Tax=Nematostella vectensis TaxID=45351 RepID=UPI0020774EFC|nr:lactadherin isoform X2 [Nematostella vectensis]
MIMICPILFSLIFFDILVRFQKKTWIMMLYWYFFCMFLMALTPVIAAEKPKGIIRDKDDFSLANFVKHELSRLNVNVLERSMVEHPMECWFKCMDLLSCFSINTASSPDSSSRYWCELLATDKYNASDKFDDNDTLSHHFSIAVATQCLNGGKCRANYHDNTASCVCLQGYSGNNCQKVAIGLYNRSIILDSQFSASSFRDPYGWPKEGRLYNRYVQHETFGCWRPLYFQAGEYLQVDLLSVKTITGVATQGYPYTDFWVTRYGITYNIDGLTWNIYPHEFTGNSDKDTVVSHDLPIIIEARLIRFVVKAWYEAIFLRAELYAG